MSGRWCSMPPRSEPTPERPPVENCTMMPGQMLADALLEVGELVRVRGGGLIVVADVDVHQRGARFEAACVDSICSLTVIGTAGLFSLRGTDPVMAAVMMQG